MTALGVQVGVAACVVGAFLVALALLSWGTLRLSGSRTIPPVRRLGALLSENPYEASLAMMAHLLRPGLVVVALGGALTIASALVGVVT